MENSSALRRVLYSGFRFEHHNQGSGYDAVVMSGSPYVCGNDLPLASNPETSVPRRLNFLLVDLLTLWRGIAYDTIHYFYPEQTAFLSPLVLKFLGKRIVYTVHLEDRFWFEPYRRSLRSLKQLCLRRADVIITLSSQQELIYKERFPRKVVRFVPHGLDFRRRRPADEVFESRLRNRQIVVVGSNYRDFNLLEKIVASRQSRRATFHLVGMSEPTKARFRMFPAVVCHSRLSSERYEELLEQCTAMLLPLTFATANNAMLEAYKCLLPVLSSDLAGVQDYAIAHDMLFRDAEEFWVRWDGLCDLGVEEYRACCEALHEKAQASFSWNSIQKALRAELY